MAGPAADDPEEWRLLETPDVPAAFAMGLDEALLRSVGAVPTLRLYSWAPEALSLGYFQAFEDVPAAAEHPCVVRRLTGGGAIQHHAGELTFSVALDAAHPAYRGRVPDSYARTHRAVARALEAVGVPSVAPRGERTCASDLEDTGMCFHDSTPMDLCWEMPGAGLAKGVGTAQRRTAGRVLHHGSIKLYAATLEPAIAHAAGAGASTDHAALSRALIAAFEDEFQIRLVPSEPTPEELRAAEELGARYGAPGFVHRDPRRGRGR